MSLNAVHEKYCVNSSNLLNVQREIKKLDHYPVDVKQIHMSLKIELENFKDKEKKFRKQLVNLQELIIHKRSSQSQLLKSLKVLEKTDVL